MLRWWLGAARRYLRYRTEVAPLIERAAALACESCGQGGSRGNSLAVELMVPTDALADRFEMEETSEGGFDALAWRTFFLRMQKFRTVCGACVRARGAAAGAAGAKDLGATIKAVVTTRTDPTLGTVSSGEVGRSIARAWLAKARQRISAFAQAGPGAVRLPPGAQLDLAGDDNDEADARGKRGGGVPVQSRPVILTSASIALATRWLAEARKKLLRG